MKAYALGDKTITRLLRAGAPRLLFDTARPGPREHRTYLFSNPQTILSANTPGELFELLPELDTICKTKWIAGYLAYEAGLLLEPRLTPLFNGCAPGVGLAWFGVFDKPQEFDLGSPDQGAWSTTDLAGAPIPELTLHIDQAEYQVAIDKIKEYIAAGDTYQVNYTFPAHLSSTLSAAELYLYLRRLQPVAYGACCDTGNAQIVSLSPELFFRRQADKVEVMPMKGTAPRCAFPGADLLQAQWLANDHKNRAENIMVVDMLRNDLGRICRTGSVQTSRLFEVQTHPTVHQMTSTIIAQLRPGAGLEALFRALFPCGSVTGAPKIRTMEIIASLENRSRGVYCGALGFAGPGGKAVFSVPIRTLVRCGPQGPWDMGVGSGIVADSQSDNEWQECRTKTRFVTTPPRQFQLVESLLWHKRYYLAGLHEKRIASSAASLGFPFCARRYQRTLSQLAATLDPKHSYKVRLLLDSGGFMVAESAIIETAPAPAVVFLAPLEVSLQERLLYHKTTFRPWYAAAMQEIQAGHCYDIVYYNERGEITEGARSNVFVRINDKLLTPSQESGLLAGVLRSRLLAQGRCEERVLSRDDLRQSSCIYCGNSVRGLVRVRLVAG